MRRILAPILFFAILLFGALLLPKTAYAVCAGNAKIIQSGFEPNFDFPSRQSNNTFDVNFKGQVTIYTDGDCFSTGETPYNLVAHRSDLKPDFNLTTQTANYLLKPGVRTDGRRSITFDFDLTNGKVGKDYPGSWVLKVCQEDTKCERNVLVEIPIKVGATPTPIPEDLPKAWVLSNQCAWQTGSEIELILDLKPGQNYIWWWHGDLRSKGGITLEGIQSNPFKIPPTETQDIGIRTFCIDIDRFGPDTGRKRCVPGDPNSLTFKFQSIPPEGNVSCTTSTGEDIFLIGGPLPLPCEEGRTKEGTLIKTSETPGSADEIIKCDKVRTAVGSISTDPAGFIDTMFKLLLGISGGIAVILIIASGYRLMTSQGNPEQVQGAREMLTSAIVGLLFIIFSFVILQIIGVDILQIPGFGG